MLDIVCRWPGSTHDATILRNSRIYSKFEANTSGNAIVVGDSGYPCNRWLMTPLTRVGTSAEALYNESLIRTRNCVERSYGVWKRRFLVLSLGIRLKVKEVEAIVVATAVLHNICNLNNDTTAPSVPEHIEALIDTEVAMPAFATSSNNFYRSEIIMNHFENL